MKVKFFKIFSLLLFFGNLAGVFAIWLALSPSLKDRILSGPLIAIGGLLGLLAFYFVLWQMLLIGRIGFIEKAWGHDRLSHLHHLLGLTAVSLLFFHPILITIGYSHEAQTTLTNQFVLFLTNYEDILAALVGYLMFLGIIVLSINIVQKKLRYELWYLIHVTLYLAIVLSFNHQLSNGHDLVLGWAPVYWQILFWGTLALVAYSRFIRPIWGYYRYGFYVQVIKQETPNVISIIIGGRNLDQLQAQAGQFIIVRFFAKGFWWEAHPFSLSEVPDGHRLRITPKAVGDFTKKLPSLPVGTKVLVEGPLGRFTADRAGSKPVLLIAGGIGITPLRGLLEIFTNKGQKVDLLYAARSDQDMALKDELDRISHQVHYLSEGKFGRMSKEMILQYIPDVAHRFIFLCGPPPMMKAVREQLISLGVPKNSILYEKFSLG